MNWNSNDTKYIIKRFIIYILICIAMFIIGTWKASALTQPGIISSGQGINITNGNVFYDYRLNNGNQNVEPFKNNGEGNVIFTIVALNAGTAVDQLKQVLIVNDRDQFTCKLGTGTNYVDNTTQRTIYTVDCPVNFTDNYGMKYLRFIRSDNGGILVVSLSAMATFVSKDSPNDYTALIQALDNQTNIIASTINQSNQGTQQAINDVNNSINNDNVPSSDADDFSNNQAFSDSTGLESVIQLPLNMVNSLTSTCQPIQITIPFIDYTGEIPCMSTIYRSKFNTLYTIVKLVINGFFVYRLLLKIYELVHNAKQPDEDKLEVIDL